MAWRVDIQKSSGNVVGIATFDTEDEARMYAATVARHGYTFEDFTFLPADIQYLTVVEV